MSELQGEKSTNQMLAEKYRPLLVLFPEIADNSERQDNHRDVGNQPGPIGAPPPGRPPLKMDYHPRDVRLVLDHARLPLRTRLRHRKKLTPAQWRDRLLEGMSNRTISHIDLIDRHGPQEVDKFWRVYAQVLKKDENPDYQRKAYARVVRGDGWFKDYTSIQYWLAYFFDDWANVHEMDWEMVSVILKTTGATEKPVAGVYCSHIGAFRKPWKDMDKAGDDGLKNPDGTHPIAYIANGSHASYFSDYPAHFNVSEPYLSPMLKLLVRVLGMARPFTDYVPSFEVGFKCFPEIDVIPEPGEDGWTEDWRWLNFTGKWGSPVELSLFGRLISHLPGARYLPMLFERPIREAGPSGPNTRGTCWENPFDWANLECLDAGGTCNWIEASCQDKPG